MKAVSAMALDGDIANLAGETRRLNQARGIQLWLSEQSVATQRPLPRCDWTGPKAKQWVTLGNDHFAPLSMRRWTAGQQLVLQMTPLMRKLPRTDRYFLDCPKRANLRSIEVVATRRGLVLDGREVHIDG